MLLKGVHFLLQNATIRPKPKFYIPAVVTCGMLGFLFAAAFECHAPDFWAIRSGQCFDQVGIKVQSSVTCTKRSSDSLLDCLWSVRRCHRHILYGHFDSYHHVPADAERSKDEAARCSRNAVPVSSRWPGEVITLSLHSFPQTYLLRHRSSPTSPPSVHVAQLYYYSVQARYPYTTPIAPRSRRPLHG